MCGANLLQINYHLSTQSNSIARRKLNMTAPYIIITLYLLETWKEKNPPKMHVERDSIMHVCYFLSLQNQHI